MLTHHLFAAGSNVSVNIGGLKSPSTSVLIILVLTVLSVAPAVLMLMTSFPRILIVLSLTRNARAISFTVSPDTIRRATAICWLTGRSG